MFGTTLPQDFRIKFSFNIKKIITIESIAPVLLTASEHKCYLRVFNSIMYEVMTLVLFRLNMLAHLCL